MKIDHRLKIVLLLVLLIPIFFFSIFFFGEVFGGDVSGFGHLLQVLPFVLLWFLVFKYL